MGGFFRVGKGTTFTYPLEFSTPGGLRNSHTRPLLLYLEFFLTCPYPAQTQAQKVQTHLSPPNLSSPYPFQINSILPIPSILPNLSPLYISYSALIYQTTPSCSTYNSMPICPAYFSSVWSTTQSISQLTDQRTIQTSVQASKTKATKSTKLPSTPLNS
jgi:hypothetical protein